MNLSKNANGRMWDALLKELLLENMNAQVAELSCDEVPAPSDNFERNISKIMHSVGRKEAARNIAKLMKNGVLMIAVVLSVTFCMLLTQPKVYAAVSDVIRTAISGGFDKFTFQSATEEFDSTIRPSYVPDGYKLRLAEYADSIAFLTYEDYEESTIDFKYGLAENTSFSIDNERHEYMEISKSGTTYYLYLAKENGDWSSVVWQKGGYAFCIDAHFDENELVKIAESVEF